MNDQEAYHAVGLLIGGVKFWPEAATDAFVHSFEEGVDDPQAMIEVCSRIGMAWGDQPGHPTLKEVFDEYRKHPRVVAERESTTARAMARTVGATHCDGSRWVDTTDSDGVRRKRPCPRCNPLNAIYGDEDKWARWRVGAAGKELLGEVGPPLPACKVDTWHETERMLGPGEGMAIARDAYRSAYGRDLGEPPVPNSVFAVDVIQRLGRFDPTREVWRISFAQFLDEFRGDQARARASLKELGRRVDHDERGVVTLRLPDEEPVPVRAPDPLPSERTPDPSGLLAEALGTTRRRMEEG
jgi:hypothetical protein